MRSVITRYAVILLVVFSSPTLSFAAKDYTTGISIQACMAKEDYKQLAQALRNRDRKTYFSLTKSKKCETIPAGTRVKVVQHDEPLYSQLETLDGNPRKFWTNYLGTQK